VLIFYIPILKDGCFVKITETSKWMLVLTTLYIWTCFLIGILCITLLIFLFNNQNNCVAHKKKKKKKKGSNNLLSNHFFIV
jgi:hypothetical protein